MGAAAMHRSKWPIALGGALLLYALYASQIAQPIAAPPQPDSSKKQPAKPKPKPPANRPCPNCPQFVAEQRRAPRDHAPQLGGTVSPDGAIETIPLPDPLTWPHNIASRGLGCCGFRALDYLARLQNVPELVDWPEQLRSDGVAGGAYPEKVEAMIRRYASGVLHWQDTTKSHAVLAAALQSQRGVAVDYNGHDPHYHGGIAHCVTLVAFDEAADWVAILDNNYPTLEDIVWMSVADFDRRWGGWAYGLLAVTPGYCAGKSAEETWEFFADKTGTVNYGLERRGSGFGSYVILNGEKAKTADILDAIGPAMAPIKVDVDHKMEPISLDLSPLTVALSGGAVLLFYVLTQKKE